MPLEGACWGWDGIGCCGGRGDAGSPIIRLCLRLALSVATLSPRVAANADAREREADWPCACPASPAPAWSLGMACGACAEFEAAEDSAIDSASFSVVASVPLSSTTSSSPSSDGLSSCTRRQMMSVRGQGGTELARRTG